MDVLLDVAAFSSIKPWKMCLRRDLEQSISTLMALYPHSTAFDKRYEHVLQMAAFLNKHELVATLLSRGVDVNVTGHYYGTALQAAARYGHNDMVLQLISAGAQFNILQGQWETALRAAIIGGHEDVVRMQTSIWDQITAILEAGAVPSDVESDRMEITKALIDSGANINSVGRQMGSSILYDEHASPLCAAIAKKRLDVAKLLLEHGADVNQTVENCKSPLSLAVEVEDQSLVCLVLKHGANVGTVLTEAAEHNHWELFKTWCWPRRELARIKYTGQILSWRL
ncbi:hypothetical protein CEP51_002383 [Fusarium floridanum]|uniref:Uncharacterized protein n=1 Tax=Fusarium floridanum TaxID=1325733 RepID=A0A428SBR3_9HYPO|nr:hypothetical protein CEP51_002383 [Fusarium floridanum]